MRLRLRAWLVVTALFCVAVLPLHSAFRGKNGRIIFLQGPNGFVPNLFSMNPDGSGERQITHFNGVGLCCEAVSPDGRQIVFTEFPDNAPPELWMVNSDGSDLHKLLSEANAGDQNGSFSADGTAIFFTRCLTDGCAIYRVQANGSGLKEITPYQKDIFDFFPVASPDGHTIAFNSFNRGGILGALYLVETDGSHLRRLTPAFVGAAEADWSPDGKSLAFETHCCNPQNAEIWAIHVDGSGLRAITHPGTSVDLRPSWAPEGNALTFDRCFLSLNKCAIYVLDFASNREMMVRQMSVAPQQMSNVVKRSGQAAPLQNRPKQIEFDAFRAKWAVAH